MADLAAAVAGFGALLRAAGLPVGPDRCARFARAVTVVRPHTADQLRWCARATLIADPDHIAVLDRVFDAVFAGTTDTADSRGPGTAGPDTAPPTDATSHRPPATLDLRTVASAAERLANRDFADLSTEELAQLADAMRQLDLVTPARRSRRTRPVPHGHRVDLRDTLRRGRRTGGDPLHLVRHQRRDKPRRLVALCDISGSMEPYARALLQLLYCAARGNRTEVFAFATRLTRLTAALAAPTAPAALDAAGRAAPDWSGGTRIADALKGFIDGYGRGGMARGAVVLILSDGWETGDPTRLGEQMARLSRLAYRIVWANPRTQSPRYQPLAGGMAAAWPYCDAVVSAHRLTALADLVAALADPARHRRHTHPTTNRPAR